MSYRTILTYLPGPDKAEELLNVAVPMATRYDAHLVCLHVIPELEFYQPVGMYYDGSIIDAQRSALGKEADEIKDVVQKWAQPNDAKIEWRCMTASKGPALDYIVDQSMFADLVIAEQKTPVDLLDSRADIPVQIALNGGRPVLAIPEGCKFDGVARHALVAWNMGKSASRAAFDAIPLLRNAKDVTLFSVASDEPEDGITPEQYMTLSLDRHDIGAQSVTDATDEMSVGEKILDYAKQTDSDLLVIGCYGHSRLREIAFGGVTRHILRNAQIPLFLSH